MSNNVNNARNLNNRNMHNCSNDTNKNVIGNNSNGMFHNNNIIYIKRGLKHDIPTPLTEKTGGEITLPLPVY